MSAPKIIRLSGLVTVEEIPRRSWLLRGRINDESLTSAYGWVGLITEPIPGRCEVKGHLARNGYSMKPSEYRAVQRYIEQLGFAYGEYQRMDSDGKLRIAHEITRDSRIAQKTD